MLYLNLDQLHRCIRTLESALALIPPFLQDMATLATVLDAQLGPNAPPPEEPHA